MTNRDNVAELTQQLQMLVSQWQEVATYWQDEKAQQFVRDYLTPITELHSATCRSSARLVDAIDHVRRSCP